MLRRNRDLKSFGGAWVFPGGRVDNADGPGQPELERARLAAIRETKEETGLILNGQDMVVLSRWIPPVDEKRRFSTWFFVARAPEAEVVIDEGEIHDFRWLSPREIVARAPDPKLRLFPPTYISLHSLQDFTCPDRACQDIAARGNPTFETKRVKTESAFITLWDPDVAYHSGDITQDGPRHRLTMTRREWRYEQTPC